MRIFGIDPGSLRTGFGCIETDGTRHRMVSCGVVATSSEGALPGRLRLIYDGLVAELRNAAPDSVAIENVFYARNVKSALTLGHARGVAMLAAAHAERPVFEYTPAEIKQSVVGYGRAEKAQMQQMVMLLLGLDTVPSPHDAADALAIAMCHAHLSGNPLLAPGPRAPRHLRSWRHVKPSQLAGRQSS